MRWAITAAPAPNVLLQAAPACSVSISLFVIVIGDVDEQRTPPQNSDACACRKNTVIAVVKDTIARTGVDAFIVEQTKLAT